MCGAYPGACDERASRDHLQGRAGVRHQPAGAARHAPEGAGPRHPHVAERLALHDRDGQGCPDTAACDTRYYGFFNQVYGAAWQFKRYANPPGTSQYFTWYAPGKTWNIRYHPNVDCGSSPVLHPEPGDREPVLLHALPAERRGARAPATARATRCSGYGNRNFYNYFTDWFGSTQRDGRSRRSRPSTRLRAATRVSGAPTVTCSRSPERRRIRARPRRGSVYWYSSTGAKTCGSVRCGDYYFAAVGADGDMGWPVPTSSRSQAHGDGIAQLFTGGPCTPARRARSSSAIRCAGYFASGRTPRRLGWPQVGSVVRGPGVDTSFEGGSVVSSHAGAFGLFEPVRAAFDAAGGVRGVGCAGHGSRCSSHGGGLRPGVRNGVRLTRRSGPAFSCRGRVRDHYFSSDGAAGALGFPLAAQQCEARRLPAGVPVRLDPVDRGSGRPGRRSGDRRRVRGARRPDGLLGRDAAFVYYPYNGGGFAEAFANGAIFYKPAVGALVVSGTVRDVYFATRWGSRRTRVADNGRACLLGGVPAGRVRGRLTCCGSPARARVG